MTGCDTITLKRFKIPFGAVEMTQKLKAHTVLPEVPVLILCTHMRRLTISVSPGNLPVSSSPLDITCSIVPVYAHTQIQNTRIFHSSPFCLPPSLSSFSLSLPISLSLWRVGLLLCIFKHGQQRFHESSGDPSQSSGIPWINSGRKGRGNGTLTKSRDPTTHVPLWKNQADNTFSQREASFGKQLCGKKHKRGLAVLRIKQEL